MEANERNGLEDEKLGNTIEDIISRTGLTEEEARARYHLGEAFKALRKVTGTPVAPGVKPLGSMYAFGAISGHFDALNNFLAWRVLERERPEGWARPDQRS